MTLAPPRLAARTCASACTAWTWRIPTAGSRTDSPRGRRLDRSAGRATRARCSTRCPGGARSASASANCSRSASSPRPRSIAGATSIRSARASRSSRCSTSGRAWAAPTASCSIRPRSSADGTTALDWWFPSADGRLLAYGTSEDGTEKSTLRRARRGHAARTCPTRSRGPAPARVAWLPDGSRLLLHALSRARQVPTGEENYHRHVFFHASATPRQDDRWSSARAAARRGLAERAASRPTAAGSSVTRRPAAGRSTEVYLPRPGRATLGPLRRRERGAFGVTLRNDGLYLHTNRRPALPARRRRPARAARATWRDLIPEGDDVLEGVAVVGDHLARP